MDKSAIEAEISAQSQLLDSIPINEVLVSDIDRQIKKVEAQLNQRLVYLDAKFVVNNFLEEVPINRRSVLPTLVNDELWDSLSFAKIWYMRCRVHEEISFERHAKAFGFFYTIGEVKYDVGVVDYEGTDYYARVLSDERKKHKLTGAPVEIKLKAIKHLTKLIDQINSEAHHVLDGYRAELNRNALGVGSQVLGSWNHFFTMDPFDNKGNR